MFYKDWDLFIETQRTTITPIIKSDEEAHTRLMLGTELYDMFLHKTGAPPTLSNFEDILNNSLDDEEMHAIREEKKYIGWIVLQKDDRDRPDIGISLYSDYQNMGIGPEVITVFCNRLYSIYGVKRIYLRSEESNIQCQRALAKLGATLDEILPDYRFKKLEKECKSIPNILYYHIDLPIKSSVFK